ncbi:MAG: hypothetical protein H6667_14145 [Ardenticatenaceae bacterium]|nr:hypothetical protein [Ardenticatenaceae bacterium]MCB9444195.1 hypothetical protein [Ardenticatenaceae bacterium]
MVDATQDVSAVVEQTYNGQPAAYSGITPANGPGSLGWERAGPTLYVPIVKKNWYGRWSKIYIVNTGSQSTTVTVAYYNPNGTAYNGGSYALAPNGQLNIILAIAAIPENKYAAVIHSSNGQPLAAVVREGDGVDARIRPSAFNAFSSGNTTLYSVLVKKNFSGHTTGLVLQNLGGPASGQALYCDRDGNCPYSVSFSNIPPYTIYTVYNPSQVPDGFSGSVRVTSNQPMIGIAAETNEIGGRRAVNNLLVEGKTTIVFPHWYNDYWSGGHQWLSGTAVRNAGSSTTVMANWYNQNGTLVHTANTALGTNDSFVFSKYTVSMLPSPFAGSLVLSTTNGQPIVATENTRDLAGSDDTLMSISGSHR